MGRALISGMLSGGVVQADRVHVVERNADSRNWWAAHQPGVAIENLSSAVSVSDAIILAVKPHGIAKVLAQKSKFWQGKLVVSVAAGVSLQTLASGAEHGRVVRVMPNTPSLIGAGASAFCVGEEVTEEDRQVIAEALGAVGLAIEVQESHMDAVTGLSGSGPAYVCVIIEALADGAVSAGLPRPLATKLATQTVLGTATMIQQTGRHPAELKDAVASPGGTTIAGLRALEQNGVRGGLIAAVNAAADRSRELGQ